MNAYVCQNLSDDHFNYVFKYVTLNMFGLSYANYISMKLLKITTAIEELWRGQRCHPIKESWPEPRGPGREGSVRTLSQVSQTDGRESRQCHRVRGSPRSRAVGPCGIYLPAEMQQCEGCR